MTRIGNIYLVLELQSKIQLENWLRANIENGPYIYPKHYLHHTTLRYKTDLDSFWAAHQIKGNLYTVKVDACYWDSRIQAIKVELPEDLQELYERKTPHITVSTRPGIEPQYSEGLVQNLEFRKFEAKNMFVQMRANEFEFRR